MKANHFSIFLPELPNPVACAGILYEHPYVYVFGGSHYKDSNWRLSGEVYCLHIFNKLEWELYTTLQVSVSWPLVLSTSKYMYIFGGSIGTDNLTADVQRYDKAVGTWSALPDLPCTCDALHAGVVLYQGRVNIFTSTERIRMYKGRKKITWKTQRYNNVGDRLTPVAHRGIIIACVFVNYDYVLKSYDLRLKNWSILSPRGGCTYTFFVCSTTEKSMASS